VAALKLWALDVAAFMLFAKAHIATVAATMTAIPTPVKAKKVAVLMFKAFDAATAAHFAAL
jgi:hypothetical protein